MELCQDDKSIPHDEQIAIGSEAGEESPCPSENNLSQAKQVFKIPTLALKPRLSTSTAKQFVEQDIVNVSKFEESKLSKEAVCSEPDEGPKQPTPKNDLEVVKPRPPELAIPYNEPSWGSRADEQYFIEVVKNGTIIDKLAISNRSFHVFGRLPSCNFSLDHPSLSRYHAVIQYCGVKNEKHDAGWYLFDLDSTHGTWVNKIRLKPRVYFRIRVGYVIKFGGSTRLHVMQGPCEDVDDESELSATELKEQRAKQLTEVNLLKAAELAAMEGAQEALEKAEGKVDCSWGMDVEDAIETEGENPFAVLEPQNEQLYIDDPKKALRGFFEREGLDLPEYRVEEDVKGKYRCFVELPLDNANGEPLIAEATVSGKKREAVAACALEACRILDRQGELRKSHHESRKKKLKDWAEHDYYDSDEDIYLDRTGDIEKKRQQRMKRIKKRDSKASSYSELKEQHDEIEGQIQEIQKKLDEAKANAARYENVEGVDALDAFMESIKSGSMDTKTRMALKKQLHELTAQKQQVAKLLRIACPPDLLPLAGPTVSKPASKQSFPVIGKMKSFGKAKKLVPKDVQIVHMDTGEDIEEDEEDDSVNQPDSSKDLQISIADDQSTSTDKKEEISDSKYSNCDVDDSEQCAQVESEDKGQNSASQGVQARLERLLQPLNKPGKKDTPSEQPRQTSQEPVQNSNKVNESKPCSASISKTSSRKRRKPTEKKIGNTTEYCDDDDPDIASWLPPEGQTGDGKTSLNAKFGY